LAKGNLSYGVELKSELISEVHFDNYFKEDDFERSDRNYVFIFGWIAVFLLLIACFNFVNLSTARASKRLKEVGVRKTTGANRKQLIIQFLGESFILSFIAMCAGILLLFFFIPAFNSFTHKDIHLQSLFSGTALWVMIALLFFISTVGGIYPAIYLSGFQPVNILKGNLPELSRKGGYRINLRQLLVVSQFAISGAVIICTILVYQQLRMMKTKDLGFDKEQVMVIRFPKLDSVARLKATAFKTSVAGLATVRGVAAARQPFSSAGNSLFWIKNGGKSEQASLNWGMVDDNYVKLLNLKIVQGRNFSKDFGDKECYIISESALKFMKLKDPLNTEISWDNEKFGKIVGIIKDFNYASPHTKIDPLVLKYAPQGSLAFIKLTPQNITSGIEQVSKTWKSFFPTNPLSYYFLDERFNEEYYRNEDIMLVLLTCFATLTIIISCLGLFGLAAFVTEQRTKEIAIRKVVGASVSNIVYHISRNFILLVVIAGAIASPVAWYFIHNWLQDFAYRIDISFWIFLVAIAMTMIVAFLTLSARTLSAANANPVKSLRTE
jgi:putative ABC transport system permease protein